MLEFRELYFGTPECTRGGPFMLGFCAKCGQKCRERLLCSLCGALAAEDGAAAATQPLPMPIEDETPDGPSFGRRLALGGITLFGLLQALKHFTVAGALAATNSSTISPEAMLGLLVASTLAAAVVAGTVNRRAELAGIILGLAAAAGYVGVDAFSRSPPPLDWLVGVPILLVMVGAVGGLAGRLMVPPAPTLPRFGGFDSRSGSRVLKPSVPLVWWRLAAGAMLVVVGTEYSDAIRQGLSQILAGRAGSFGSAKPLTWQISVVCGIAGGIFAGANTRRGARQGFVAGLAAGTVVVILQSANVLANAHLMEFWLDQLELDQIGPMAFAALGGCTLIAMIIGGWLGAHIMPPRQRV
jgi:hypothetical protein